MSDNVVTLNLAEREFQQCTKIARKGITQLVEQLAQASVAGPLDAESLIDYLLSGVYSNALELYKGDQDLVSAQMSIAARKGYFE